MGSKPSLSDYEAMLRAGLASVSVVVADMDGCYAGRYEPDKKLITLDSFHGGLLDTLLHELLHHCQYNKLSSFGAGEEIVVEALEDLLVRYVNRSQRRRRWWRRALSAKLAEGK